MVAPPMILQTKNHGQKIGIAGNQTTTIDVINSLHTAGYSISYVINVGPEKAHMIADYVDLTELTKKEYRVD